MIEREIARLESRLSGLRTMKRIPDILFVVDVHREDTAVHEANLKDIPVVAMVDTNCDPKDIDFVIPSNDDAIRAIKLLVGRLADAVMEGRTIRGKESDEEMMLDEAISTDVDRFMRDDDEFEDEELLGESTLKHLGSSAKKVNADEDEEDELDDSQIDDVVVEDSVEEQAEPDDEAEDADDDQPVNEDAAAE